MHLRPVSARALTLSYVAALLIIAGLSIASHALLNYDLRSSEGSAAVINMAGRQRMLSQRIASLSGQIRLGDESARMELRSAIGEFETAHDALALASRVNAQGNTADDPLAKLYYEPDHGLNIQVRDYVANARRVLDLQTNDPAMAEVSSHLFVEARAPLLKALNDVVTIHQHQSEARLAQLRRLQWAILGIVLITLLVEALAIFRPMIRRIAVYTTELLRLASTDALTGAANRHHFMEACQSEFDRARRYDRPLSLLILDADHFKSINDTRGHAAGDQVLKAIGAMLRASIRKSDICGRLGGEEFAVLLVETELPEAVRFAERLRHEIASEAIRYDETDIRLTVSIGVTAVLKNGDDFETALKHADALMYRAKRDGRNRVASEALIASPE